MPPSLPEAIGKYTVERFIESGGMGDVYLARDPTLDRPVAIKFLREGFDSDEMRERFEREARAAGRLSHPNIVTIYEFGEFDRRPFIAMEFVRGEPLSKLIRRREAIPLERKLEMMEGLCAGLGHAHKAGIVHRDIKPANLMVDLDGPLKILDFGIVRMAGSGLTSHGVLVGTINYMSPEQIAGSGAIDHRSDVFAVGSVLHELFTYQRAFPGEMTDVLYKIVHTQPESAAVLVPGLDPGIVRAIDQCLQKAPERRYQDLNVLRRDLARIRQRIEIDDAEHGPTSIAARPTDPHNRAHRPSAGTPPPSVPPSLPRPTPPPPPGTSPSERARRADQAAAAEAERARVEEAQRQERARLERERADRLRLEQAQAEQARQEQARQEQLRQEQARVEQARIEAARAEEARQAKRRAEEAERARVDRERAEQARLDEARKAREAAERQRADDQRRAQEEAARQAEARRQQRQRDVAEATQLVSAGRFAEAVQRLTPWIAESGSDATFNGVLREAKAGVEKLEAEKRAREALAREVSAAAELLVRQDLLAASRAVQAILKAHPGHPPALNLEREIVIATEVRAKAESTVQRARALFDAQPGEALTLLERFTPPHALVDGTLNELRATYAAREQARQRQEREARRRESRARLGGQARALAENRVVQAAAAILVLGLGFVVWRGFAPTPLPVDPRNGGSVGGSAGTGGTPHPAGGGDTNPRPTGGDEHLPGGPVNPKPSGGEKSAGNAAGIDKGLAGDPKLRDPRRLPPDPNGTSSNPGGTKTGGGRLNTGLTDGGTNAGNTTGSPGTDHPPNGGATNGGANAGGTTPDGGTKGTVDVPPKDPDPGPSRPKDPGPSTPDPVAVARGEILNWMEAYKQAYANLDGGRVTAMNHGAKLSPLLKSAAITFSNVSIDINPDGQTASLRANVRYQYQWNRAGLAPDSELRVSWPLKKVNGAWVAN